MTSVSRQGDGSSPPSTILTPIVHPALAYSDRIVLPQSILEQLIERYGREELPSPLTFRLFNPVTGLSTHCGVREFSASEKSVLLSQQLASILGINKNSSSEKNVISVEECRLPKGESVKLMPLDSDYLNVEDWKSLLESSLQASYTTLTEGQTLSIMHPGTNQPLKFLVESLKPEKAVCIIETDLEVDMVPMSEDHAMKSVKSRDAKRAAQISDKIIPLSINTTSENTLSEERKVIVYELSQWDRSKYLVIKLECDPDIEDKRAVDLYVSIDGQPSQDYFLWSTLSDESNIINISPTNDFLARASKLFLAVSSVIMPSGFRIQILSSDAPYSGDEAIFSKDSNSKQCSNCHQYFKTQTYQLHSAFCERNNILCPYPGCGRIFRRQEGLPESHWHCEYDGFAFDSKVVKQKHLDTAHTPVICSCGENFPSVIQLAQHRVLSCPNKLHICRFCHLKVPQERPPELQADILAGFSGHEAHCGTRTTECSRCGRITRLRDLDQHLRLHDIQRISAPLPIVCNNELCTRTLDSDAAGSSPNTLGLCSVCYGPLYSPLHDPTGAKLRSRIERRYFIQLTTGCKKSGCRNSMCSNGRQNLKLTKLSMTEVAATVKELVGSLKLIFCVDDAMNKRKILVDWIADEGEYPIPWICKAVNEVYVDTTESPEQKEPAIKNWLSEKGVKLSELH
ncbi:ubiquitin fusion degradation protein UFD1-domain-containing protein [Dipodascopsis uninucleata]